jgi:PAS domain-containing protein
MDERPLVRCLNTGEVIAAEETLVQRSDGSRGVSLIWVSPVRNSTGELVAAVAVTQDITGENLSPRPGMRCCRRPHFHRINHRHLH